MKSSKLLKAKEFLGNCYQSKIKKGSKGWRELKVKEYLFEMSKI